MIQEPRLAQRPDEVAAHRVGVVLLRVVLADPGVRFDRQFSMLFIEKGPVIGNKPVHQLPSKTGLFFAAKASNARWKSWVCMQIACACASISIASSTLTFH